MLSQTFAGFMSFHGDYPFWGFTTICEAIKVTEITLKINVKCAKTARKKATCNKRCKWNFYYAIKEQ